ncbi:hypothetical protein NLI96_g13027 [Meripilus lineatus]|uniref:Uncharacterized protein n=1 Tax=Meripilus lineatus TaxID=2056292 RepID=A0AAD5YBV2_9APHY|nr:hypothetical protein NLI96_g13027 [Physisporinus lineatus]
MEDDRRSRASSTSSYHHPASPQLDVTRNFEGLNFESPNWQSNQLPLDRPSPPAHKPQSPPQLLIPDATSPPPSAPPLINAPDGDGVIHEGPRLQILPPTPISGGDSTAQNVPFRNTMDQGTFSPTCEISRDLSNPAPPFPTDSQQADWESAHLLSIVDCPRFSTGAVPDSQQLSDIQSQQQQQQQKQQQQRQPPAMATYLHPPIQRSRSLSDTSVRPGWDLSTNMIPQAHHQGSSADIDVAFGPRSHESQRGATLGTVNMHDVLPDPSGTSVPGSSNAAAAAASLLHSPPLSSAPPHQSSFGSSSTAPGSTGNFQSSPRLSSHYSTGPPGAYNQHLGDNSSGHTTDFLSPDFSLGALVD